MTIHNTHDTQSQDRFNVDATMRACVDGVRQAHADKEHLQRVENMLYDSRRSNEQLRDIIADLHRELDDAYRANFEQRQRYNKQHLITLLICTVLLITALTF